MVRDGRTAPQQYRAAVQTDRPGVYGWAGSGREEHQAEQGRGREDQPQITNEEEIKNVIKEIEKIEGGEGLVGGYLRVRSLVWQAPRASDKSQQLAKQAKDAASEAERLSSLKASEQSRQRAQTLRIDAHQRINELMSHRGDWSVVHLALAQLNEQEVAKPVWMRHRSRKSRRASSIPISGLSN